MGSLNNTHINLNLIQISSAGENTTWESDSKSTSTESTISTAAMEQIIENLKLHCV